MGDITIASYLIACIDNQRLETQVCGEKACEFTDDCRLYMYKQMRKWSLEEKKREEVQGAKKMAYMHLTPSVRPTCTRTLPVPGGPRMRIDGIL